jgi:hypothetical protein
MEKFKLNILDWLEKYDKNTEQNTELLKNAEYFKYYNNNSNLENDKIAFFDKNKKKIIEADIERIGVYFLSQRMWIWAWAMPNRKLKTIRKVTLLLKYALTLEDPFLRTQLVNSRYIIKDPIQIDIHLAISSELTKNPFIFQFHRIENENLLNQFLDNEFDGLLPIWKKIGEDENIAQTSYWFLYNIVTF